MGGPLLQGTYRYYYRLSDLEFGPNSFSTFDKELGEGAAFIFPILPKLWACSTREKKERTLNPELVEVLPETLRSISFNFSLLSSATINASESNVNMSEVSMMAISLTPNLIM